MKSKEPKSGKTDKEDKDDRKSFPLRLPKATLKAMKLRALEGDTSVQKILEGLIDAYLGYLFLRFPGTLGPEEI